MRVKPTRNAHFDDYRTTIYKQFETWSGTNTIRLGHARSDHLAWILGFKTFEDMYDNYNEETVRTAGALAGPHGLTIYKMLVLKRVGTAG